MKYTVQDDKLTTLYVEGSDINWVEGTFHRWGEAVYPEGFSLKTERTLNDDVLSESYIFTNVSDHDITFAKGELGIWTPFNDNYEGAEVCKKYKCHAHIWLGGASSWVNAMQMKAQPPHLGLMLTSGCLSAYSVERINDSNDRGDFLLLATPKTVKAGESYVITWDIFTHDGNIFDKLKKYPNYVAIEADYFTFFENETPTVKINGVETVLSAKHGYHTVNVNDSFFRYQVKPTLNELALRRCRFIAEKQQETEGKLSGAYLVYDNEEKCRFFEEMPNPNHNAGRERIGMGALMARYLQRNYQPDLHESLKKYTDFVLREYFGEDAGVVYNMSTYDNSRRRIYNNAWYATFFRELYRLEKDKRWLECMFKAFNDLYTHGGLEFYPLAMEITDSILVLEEAGMYQQRNILLDYFKKNAEFIIERGTSYPDFEVKLEDNIVVPAGMLLVQLYNLSNDARYLENAVQHVNMHDIFVGFQPDARMHGASIHHWDDFWFGKRLLYGDTYPHYWSSAGAMLYADMYKATDNPLYLKKARACLRSVLSNFFDDGSATCAIFTPFRSNGIDGDFIDPWANDQDWGLYFALVFDEEFKL